MQTFYYILHLNTDNFLSISHVRYPYAVADRTIYVIFQLNIAHLQSIMTGNAVWIMKHALHKSMDAAVPDMFQFVVIP